ncbi:hypothetical protein Ahy_B04g069550 isoform B [Arachis hypogaea]|uniref:fumarylacetoacetase n=1 Tax=Arachis hypogaea TaxID=3818 RepID=A0A444ZCX7_ARAHY|nr:hypothetical protein Ahy_B04g069550 isoform B [Arachis hypogaea]
MALKSFIEVHPDSHFPIQNLPYGVFKPQPGSSPRPGVAIGDYVLDLSEIASAALFHGPLLNNSDCFHQPNLNKFVSLGRPAWKEARATLQKLLSATEPTLRDNATLREKSLVPMSRVELLLPVQIGDYTDFFSSLHHTKNCGLIFRGPQNPVLENWYHLPVAYHGRASSVVISGTDIVRPRLEVRLLILTWFYSKSMCLSYFLRYLHFVGLMFLKLSNFAPSKLGQAHPTPGSPPYFGPSRKLDFELEMVLLHYFSLLVKFLVFLQATIVGPGNDLGKPVDINNAADHIFGVVLMNDWSARDIQAWEYIPLGPFLGKNFEGKLLVYSCYCVNLPLRSLIIKHCVGTTISPWIVTLEALEPFACEAPKQDPPPLPYLTEKVSKNYDVALEVHIKPAEHEKPSVVTRSNLKHLYWTLTQQLAHHTINGCNLRPGDLLGTGTISGPEQESRGCLLELTWNGQNTLSLNGVDRKFLEDGDEVTFTGYCKGDGYTIGFGKCSGRIIPSAP